MTITAYPLTWPSGWKRTPAHERRRAGFGKKASTTASYRMKEKLTVNDATRRLLSELQRMGILQNDVIISTDIVLRQDGLPRSGQKAPTDPGAAVYWTDFGQHRCMAIDQYDRVEDNIAALAASIDYLRGIERHGGAAILDRAFTGFTALPSQGAVKGWREVLFPDGCPADVTLATAQRNYRQLASQHHPDKGGSTEMMTAINQAWEQAQQELAK